MDPAPVVIVRQSGQRPLLIVIDDPVVLGRDCEGLVLADPRVSRRHLELRTDAGDVLVTDLGSTNGTFVGGVRISEPTVIDLDSLVVLGDTTVALDQRKAQPAARGSQLGRATTLTAVHDLRGTSIDMVAGSVEPEWRPPVDGGETVTILFSDIESSTEAASAAGDATWYAILDRHNRLMREELSRAGGREIKNQGDGFMLTFPSVRRALSFAVAVQRRFDDIAHEPDSVRVRMGMHTGEAIVDDRGDLFGRHVNKAARVANLATGGQIMVSSIVREIASSRNDIEFGRGVDVALKGLDGTHTVHEVFWHAPRPH